MKKKTWLKKIFSGTQSQGIWDSINNAKTINELRMALYTVCCRVQDLEDEIKSTPRPTTKRKAK